MLINFLTRLFTFFSYFPILKDFFKFFYFRGLRKIKNHYLNNPNIVDIILTSSLKSRNFIYGHSDFNFLIIVHNNYHPKKALNEFRDFVAGHLDLRLTVKTDYIPILTRSELNTDVIKSFLIRNSYKDQIRWQSILKNKNYTFNLRKQDYFATSYSAFQNLDYYLLKEGNHHHRRSKVKNVARSLKSLSKIYPQNFTLTAKWSKVIKKELLSPFYGKIFPHHFSRETWKILANKPKVKSSEKLKTLPYSNLSPHFLKSLYQINELEFIDDISLTPSLIQKDEHSLTGKVFLDLHFNHKLTLKNNFAMALKLERKIKELESIELKIRIRYTTDKLYTLQNINCLYPFPLEPLFRLKNTFSLKQREYHFNIQKDYIIRASIHFLITQFMRFRSLEQKTDLIGSKFIKSLNLMYKYYLLVTYLETQKFSLAYNEQEIRKCLTPQFSNISASSEVTEQDWLIIKSQLLYLLKKIRNQLIKFDPNLKALRF